MWLNIVVDAVLIALALLVIVVGTRRGLIRFFLKPVRFVGALLCAWFWGGALGKAIISPLIQAPVTKSVSDFLSAHVNDITAENATEQLPTILRIAAGVFNISIPDVAAGASGSVTEAIADALTAPVVSVISAVLGMILLYIVCSIVFSLVLRLVNCVFSKGVFGVLNRTLGFIFGIFAAMLLVWGLVALINVVIAVPAVQQAEWIKDFEGGYVYRFFTKYSPIELLLGF